MAEQPQPQDLSRLSAQFRNAVGGLTHEWGFVVVRTAYAGDNDEAQWAAAMKKLRAYAAPADRNAEMDPNTLALPVIADSTILHDADYATVRKAFNGWVDDFKGREMRPSNDDDSDEEEWPSDVRTDSFIIIDQPALDSLLKAPELVSGQVPKNDDPKPWVVVVDAQDPASLPYQGGAPYMGFTRACVNTLGELFENLDCDHSLQNMTPVRRFDGQIPLYDGSRKGSLIDPVGGVEGRFKFPTGTPRGREGAQAMLAQINEALGTSYTL